MGTTITAAPTVILNEVKDLRLPFAPSTAAAPAGAASRAAALGPSPSRYPEQVPTQHHRYDTIILGAGAAGLFCAALTAERGRRVLLLDHAPRAGRKILISGGGRANFTNLNTQPEHFLSNNPHFAKSALARYTPQDFVALVERYNIAYHAKAPGQLFCDASAAQIVNMLLDLCEQAGVHLQLNSTIHSVEHASGTYHVLCPQTGATTYTAPTLVVATGGLSIPKLGATALGYDLASQFGLRIIDPRPALVPLLFTHQDQARFKDLSGVATEVSATIATPNTPTFRDKLLITHRGLSGPAILQISSYWRPGLTLDLDLAPGQQVTAPLLTPGARRDPATAAAAWQSAFPRRLADRLLTIAPPTSLHTASLAATEHQLHHWPITPAATEGYEKAEVTAGGVDTHELSARTMQAHRQPGLFFIGEVVEVTGHLGGYNFQWAWASAAAAAQSL
jgi:predicted Rossmann fold flavoprotein